MAVYHPYIARGRTLRGLPVPLASASAAPSACCDAQQLAPARAAPSGCGCHAAGGGRPPRRVSPAAKRHRERVLLLGRADGAVKFSGGRRAGESRGSVQVQ
eukprot:COSAG03_NODE_11046_length_614_cov_1.512621_2_plen_100_part_01